MARLIAISGRLTLVSLAIAVVLSGVAAALYATKLSAVALAIALISCLLAWAATIVLLGIYVYSPGPAQRLAHNWREYRTMIAAFIFATVISNLCSTGYLAVTGKLTGLGQGEIQLSPDVLVVAVISLQACLAAFLNARLVKTGLLSWQEMGFTWANIGRQIAIGVPLGAGMIGLIALSSLALRAIGIEQTQSSMFGGLAGAPVAAFAAFFLVSSVVAPFIEEAYFRGYVFQASLRSKGRWQAYAMSAGLFALAHVNLPALLPFIIFGLIQAYVVERTRTIGPCVVAHAINNGVVSIALYLAVTAS